MHYGEHRGETMCIEEGSNSVNMQVSESTIRSLKFTDEQFCMFPNFFFFNIECFVASKFLFYWTYSVCFWNHAQWLLEGQISPNCSMCWNSTFAILYLSGVEWVSWSVRWMWCLAIGNIAFLCLNGIIIPENLWRISLKILSSDSTELTSVDR